MKKAQLKSMFVMLIVFSILMVSAYAAFNRLKLDYPSSEWVLSNSVPFNFTVNTTSASISYCVVYVNNSGVMALKANYTDVVNATPHISGIAINDSAGANLYGWNVTCNNGSSDFNGSVVAFGVDANVPSIVLDSPASGSYLTNLNNTLFKYTPTDTSNRDTCLFYINQSGSWKFNQSNASYGNNVQIFVNLSNNTEYRGYTAIAIPDGQYAWGAYCNDTATNSVFAQNFTFTLDSVYPSPINFTDNRNVSSRNITPYFSWNQTNDNNFDEYLLRVSTYQNMSDPIQEISITNRTQNFTSVANLENDGVYFIQVLAFDLAGQSVNSTVLNYTLDRIFPLVTLNFPSNNSFLTNLTPTSNPINITATMIDTNPSTCLLLLSKPSDSSVTLNATNSVIANATPFNLTPSNASTIEGVYQFNVECNDTANNRANASSSNLQFTVDNNKPTSPFIISTFHQTNNTDRTPELRWDTVTDNNFSKYQVRALYQNNASVAYEVNITSRTTNYSSLNLFVNYTYFFNVTAYDLAGNTNSSQNTTIQLSYYVDPICGILNTGWNLCGAVWTTPKNLSRIGSETNATFVAVWNISNHVWATCNYAVSSGGTNCNLTTGVATYYGHLSIPTGITNATVNTTGIPANGTGLPANTYSYKISAISGTNSESLIATEVNITTDTTSNATNLTWTAVGGATSYRVYNATIESGHNTYFIVNSTTFYHTGQTVSGSDTPKTTGMPYYIKNEVSPTVWIYVNASTDYRNRTWVSTPKSMNITLTNSTNGWNVIAGFVRGGKVFGDIKNTLLDVNVSMFSLRYNNGTSIPYVNNGLYKGINNQTILDYGRGMWVYYNGTGLYTWNTGSW